MGRRGRHISHNGRTRGIERDDMVTLRRTREIHIVNSDKTQGDAYRFDACDTLANGLYLNCVAIVARI